MSGNVTTLRESIIPYNFSPRDFMPMKRFSTMSILPTPWLPLWHRQTGAPALIPPSQQPFHTEALRDLINAQLPGKVTTKPRSRGSVGPILIRLAASKLMCEVVFNQSQTDSHPTSLRYEKISSGELLDTPRVTLVTLIGTPETEESCNNNNNNIFFKKKTKSLKKKKKKGGMKRQSE